MNTADKQRLWTKYYLTHSGTRDNFMTLRSFVVREVESLHLAPRNEREKIQKVIRYMLKHLTRKRIIKKYAGMIRFNEGTKLSKNQIINVLVIRI